MDINRFLRRRLHVTGNDVLPFIGPGHFSREKLAIIFQELGYKIGAEIGVHKGEYSKVLLEKNPGLKMYCIDPWTPYEHHTTQRRQDRHFRTARHNLAGMNVEYIVKTSAEALKDIPDEHLDFVYIDGLHDFDNVILDIVGWSKKVRSGGIVSGHDYFHYYSVGVVQAVDAYTKGHNIFPYFRTQDYPPSFFWVKP